MTAEEPSLNLVIHARFQLKTLDDCKTVLEAINEAVDSLRAYGAADGELTIDRTLKVEL